MTEEQMIEMAKQIGFWKPLGLPSDWYEDDYVVTPLALQSFIKLVRNNALEEAADACETLYYGMRFQPTKGECADKIRSLKS